jgi:glycosyltransferase involved in cell wall biosynthesis
MFWDDAAGGTDLFSGCVHEGRVIVLGPTGEMDEGELVGALRASGAQVYHVPQNGFGLPGERACRSVITLHDAIPFRCPDRMDGEYVRAFTDLVPKVAERADAIITVSEYSKADLCATLGLSPRKVHVTPLAAENIYRPMDRQESAMLIRKKYGIEGDYILYVGGIGERKNIATLILAFDAVRKRSARPLQLVIAGPRTPLGKYLEFLAAMLGIADLVIFPGRLPTREMPYLYNAATLFAYLSLYEGFGLPPLEAMACGVPTVTSNTTSLPEVVADGAVCVDPLDTQQIADTICGILEDRRLYEDLAARGIRRSADFSWKSTAAQTLKIYSALCP